jgi:hypothetical protein
MALRTRDDIFTEVLVRSSRTTTDGFITDAMLKSWFFNAHNWAASSYKWPFTEARVQTTFASAGGPNADEWYFEGFKSDSFRMVQVGGKRLLKLNFQDYQILREEEPGVNDRVFTDFGRTVFINPNIGLTGTVVAYGQVQPYVDITDQTRLTVFSGYEDEGNDAVVEKMLSYLYARDTFVNGGSGKNISSPSLLHEQVAQNILDRIWKRIEDEQYNYQTHPDRGGMFRRFDVIDGGPLDGYKENQF